MDAVAKTEITPNPKGEKPLVTPREIDGLDKFVLSESFGGNAGTNRAAANALITEDHQIIFTNYADQEYGRSSDVAFGIISPDLRLYTELSKQNKPGPPFLVEKVYPKPGPLLKGEVETDPRKLEYARKRALEHNAYEIKRYLENGGELKYLSETPLMPDPASYTEAPKPIQQTNRLKTVLNDLKAKLGRN